MTLRSKGVMKFIAIVCLFVLSACTAKNIQVYLHGLHEPNYELATCWVQPSGSDLWYPCSSPSAKDQECLHTFEKALRSLEDPDNYAGQQHAIQSAKGCYKENRQAVIPHVGHESIKQEK